MYEEQVKSLGKKLQDSERKEGEFEIVRVQFVEDVSYLDFQNFSLLQMKFLHVCRVDFLFET